jgi:hypothetical protein
MFLTLGPLADRATAWEGGLAVRAPSPAEETDEGKAAAERAPGAVREASLCSIYYNETRGKTQAWIYAGISLTAPLVVLFGSLGLAARFIGEGPSTPAGIPCGSDTSASAQSTANLMDIGGRIHFAAVQVAFVVFCAAVLVISIVGARRIAAVHAWGPRATARLAPSLEGRNDADRIRILDDARARAEADAEANIVIVWLLGALALASVLGLAFHDVGALVLRPFLHELPNTACNTAAAAFEKSLTSQVLIGIIAAVGAMSALGTAVMTIAWRFETTDINGRWSDSYILREKLNLLLTLFFLGSALLVMGSLALNATLDWSTTTAGAFSPAADKALDGFRSFAKAITGFSGVTSSALLIALFVPAFMVLIDDIGVAGQTHASADMGGGSDQYAVDLRSHGVNAPLHFVGDVTQKEADKPAPPYRVAGWKKVKDWKDKHGLSMSVTDLSASFLAVAAPILSSGFIDISKTLVGGH